MTKLLENLRAAEEAKATAAKAAYLDLVQQLAHGTEDPSLNDVQAILAAAGKSASDLSSDVYVVQHRNELRDQIAEAEAASIEKQGLLEQIESAKATLEAAKRQHDETVRPLILRISDVDQLVMRAAAAKRELLEECGDEELREREHSNRRAIDRLNASIRQQAELVKRIRANHDHLVATEGKDSPDTIAKRQRLNAESDKLAATRSELNGLVAESNEIVEAKIHA